MCADVLGSPAHVFLLESRDPGADGRFDFPLSFHGILVEVTGQDPEVPQAIAATGKAILDPRFSALRKNNITKMRKVFHLLFSSCADNNQNRGPIRFMPAAGPK